MQSQMQRVIHEEGGEGARGSEEEERGWEKGEE